MPLKVEQISHLFVIVGPTAVGKTALAIELARRFDGETVSADSRQIYRGMDIGTAKPTREEQARVPHHLIDIVAPDEPYTLANYQAQAYAAIDGILARGKQPFLVGGTGLYVRAIIEGLRIPRVAPNEDLRAQLAVEDGAALYERLRVLDPDAAARIDPRNVRRTIRALEVCLTTGAKFSKLGRASPPPYHVTQIGLTLPRPELYARIDARVERMMAGGLVAEVETLVAQGYGWELPSMSGLGYREIGEYQRGQVSLDEAVANIKRDTRHFVRRQYAWFRLRDERIHWFEKAQVGEIERLVDAAKRGALNAKHSRDTR
ncbi:MAG: tRNA delta(2)-isopentenylpyrophosphate transferase [Chloroflexi bacterium]|nr:tRNA delta(2)-isopentenylpyrophosphate transferase [Chloroflexota bacterium]